jgi:glycerol-3-phosphate O-acyltransferase
MRTIRDTYEDIARKMVENSRQPHRVDETAIYQESNLANRKLIDGILEDLILPGSALFHFEHMQLLYDYAQAGKSGLILMEHYSNFDVPCLYYFLERQGEVGPRIAASIVSVAAMKLNEESRFVLAFTEAYSRIVIYPQRALNRLDDEEEERRARAFNHRAVREMIRAKNEGKLVLMFPTGTRYRPQDPDTRRVLNAVDSYMKTFDYVVFVGIAGNVLLVNPGNEMSEDFPAEDVVTFTVSPPVDSREFRSRYRDAAAEGEDPKRAVARGVEAEFARLHVEAEDYRSRNLT